MPPLDVVVVGGGITGLGIARLAARNGLSVALLERGDLASGASSATSHMLHGGLRYLEHGHFSLVREALHERSAVGRMAPDLVRPTRFLIPFYRGDRRNRWKVRLGLAVYDAFAGRSRLAPHAAVRAAEALRLEPELNPEGLVGAGLYSDTVMDDARLAVAVARDAAHHGARISTYTEVLGLRPAEDAAVELLARDRLEGAERRLVARTVINATGAWADEMRTTLLRALRPGTADPIPILRPSRGVHLVFPALTRGHGVLLFARADDRPFFVVPFGEHSLVGTTEVEVSSPPDPDALQPSVDEIRYLRDELRQALPSPAALPVIAITAGLRPLFASTGGVGTMSREHRVVEDGPIFTVVGGKYTTFRVMARDALSHVVRAIRRANVTLRDPADPLPTPPAAGQTIEGLTEHAADAAFARRVEDVVRRRSRLWLSPDRGRVAAPRVAATLAQRLGWSPERMRDELQSFLAALEREDRLLRGSREGA